MGDESEFYPPWLGLDQRTARLFPPGSRRDAA